MFCLKAHHKTLGKCQSGRGWVLCSMFGSPISPLPYWHTLWVVQVKKPYFHTNIHFINSVQFSRSVMSDSLWPHELQHARPPCPSLTPGVYPNPCPLSWWWHLTISTSVIPFSSCPQSFPASGSFPMSQLSSHQVAKVLEFQLQHQSFPWTPGLISIRMDWLDLLAVQGTLKSLLQHHSSKASILQCSAFFIV